MPIPEFSIKTPFGVTLSKQLKEADAIAIPNVKTNNVGNGYVWHMLPAFDMHGSKISFALCFHNTQLTSISLAILNPDLYGHDWNDWSEEKEKLQAKHTAEWLHGIGYPVGSYNWGQVWAGYDAKAGSGHGVIRYTL
jgi:hypothetical protein